jgi:hypothetical protein
VRVRERVLSGGVCPWRVVPLVGFGLSGPVSVQHYARQYKASVQIQRHCFILTNIMSLAVGSRIV